MTQVQAGITYPVLEKLNEFRAAGIYCDLTVSVAGQYYKCHRLVLAATCDYFDQQFRGIKDEHCTLTLPDAAASAFLEVLRLAYTNQVVVTAENVYSLLVAGEDLRLPIFERQCMEFIGRKEVPVQNAMNIFVFARAKQKNSLTSLVGAYILENFSTFSTTDALLGLSYEDFRYLLDLHQFRNADERMTVIVSWYCHARTDRTPYLNTLIDTVDIESLSSDCAKSSFDKLYPTSDGSFAQSAAGPMVSVSKDTSSLHVFVNLHERCARNQWRIFSHSNNVWQCAGDYSYTDDAVLSKFTRRAISSTIRSVSLRNNVYSLMQYDVESEPWKPKKILTSHLKFRRASSMNFAQDVYELKRPPVKRYESTFDMCASQDSIYLLTHAVDEEPDVHDYGSRCYIYDLERDQWNHMTPLSERLIGACMTANDNLVFVIGGTLSDGKPVDTFHGCDIRTPVWQALPGIRLPFVNAACCMYSGKLCVTGGDYASHDLEVFDFVAGKWMSGPRMNGRRSFHRMVLHKEGLWAIGNEDADLTIDEINPFHPYEWHFDEAFTNCAQESIRGLIREERSHGVRLFPACACISDPSYSNEVKIRIQDAVVY